MNSALSPMPTPSKSRRSCHSEYETAGEEDDSDSSLYYSMTETDRTLENKENSLDLSAKSAKRMGKGGSAATPLLRKALGKSLVYAQKPTWTPQTKVNKHVSFSLDQDLAASNSTAAHNGNTETEVDAENSFASGMTDDVGDVTVVVADAMAAEAGATAVEDGATATEDGATAHVATKLTANNEKSAPRMASEVKLIVSDFDAPHKKPILMAKSKVAANKRVSIVLTNKTSKVANTNASVRNRRQQLAVETKKMPVKRSSMYQPRRSNPRRSIEAMIIAKSNKNVMEVQAIFAQDSAHTDPSPAESDAPSGVENVVEALPQNDAVSLTSEVLTPQEPNAVQMKPSAVPTPAVSTSVRVAAKPIASRKQQMQKAAATVQSRPKAIAAPANIARGSGATEKVKQPRVSLAPPRKSIAPRLSIFSTASGTAVAVRAQRRQTKTYLKPAAVGKSEPDSVQVSSSMPPPTTSLSRKSYMVKTVTIPSAPTSSMNGGDGMARPADARRTINSGPDSLRCQQCKKWFMTELELRVHTNNFHNLNKKSAPPSNTPNALKCRYCDRQFDKPIALTNHLQENCTKIQPSERKRIFADTTDRNKEKLNATDY